MLFDTKEIIINKPKYSLKDILILLEQEPHQVYDLFNYCKDFIPSGFKIRFSTNSKHDSNNRRLHDSIIIDCECDCDINHAWVTVYSYRFVDYNNFSAQEEICNDGHIIDFENIYVYRDDFFSWNTELRLPVIIDDVTVTLDNLNKFIPSLKNIEPIAKNNNDVYMPYLDKEHEYFSSELYLAVKLWEEIYINKNGGNSSNGVQTKIMTILNNSEELSNVAKNISNVDSIEELPDMLKKRLSTVVNWDKNINKQKNKK